MNQLKGTFKCDVQNKKRKKSFSIKTSQNDE